MRKAILAICTLLAISSFAIAQTNSSTSTSSSGMQSTTSSSSFSCPCHTTQTSAENSINQLHKECKEKNGEDSFSMKKMSENCFCIEGACDIHYSSASIDTINYSSSSSSIVNSSSSEYIYTGGVCYIDSVYYEGVKNVPTVHRGLYSVLPYMKNADNIKVSKCSCNQDGSFKCNYSNFGVPIGYKPIDVPLCGLRDAYWCPGIDDGMCDYSGSSIEIYYSDQYWKTDYTWGVKNFSNNGVFEINDGSQPLYVVTTDNERYLFFWMNRPLPQNITTYDLEDAFLKANPRFPSIGKMNEYCRGEWFPHDEDCFGYASEVEIALQDSIDNCVLSMGISKYDTTLSDRGWCVVGTCEPGEDPYYSSSSYASSSSSEESSSSSEFGLCQSLPFGYIPSDPKNTCFESNGKCYRCNAARRADECDEEWMWIYPYTPDKYFFTEIDCISGERKDNNRIGQCPGFPMETTPYNPEQACIAHNGKCYRCKSENSYVNCSHDWLWTGENFGTHNIGSWYEEVDCYDPFENDDFDGQCPDELVLKKSAASGTENKYALESYTINFSPTSKTFDVLGRRLNAAKYIHQITFITGKTKNTTTLKHTFDVGSVFNIPIEKLRLSRNILAKEGADCPNYTCGKLGEDYGVRNDIGVYCGHPCTKLNMDNGFVQIKITKKEETGFCGKNNPKYTITFEISATTKIMRRDAYYVAPVGYKMGDNFVTEEDYNAGERHEKGHMESYLCLEKNNMFKSRYTFEMNDICEKDFKCDKDGVLEGIASTIRSTLEKKKETGTDELVNYNNNLWLNMCGWYHKTFSREDGPGGPGKPATLTCPTMKILSQKYDLTGCEVVK